MQAQLAIMYSLEYIEKVRRRLRKPNGSRYTNNDMARFLGLKNGSSYSRRKAGDTGLTHQEIEMLWEGLVKDHPDLRDKKEGGLESIQETSAETGSKGGATPMTRRMESTLTDVRDLYAGGNVALISALETFLQCAKARQSSSLSDRIDELERSVRHLRKNNNSF